jgi:hypothetical protein
MVAVLAVDDDCRVAQVHSGLVDSVDGMRCMGVARDAAEPLRALRALRALPTLRPRRRSRSGPPWLLAHCST